MTHYPINPRLYNAWKKATSFSEYNVILWRSTWNLCNIQCCYLPNKTKYKHFILNVYYPVFGAFGIGDLNIGARAGLSFNKQSIQKMTTDESHTGSGYNRILTSPIKVNNNRAKHKCNKRILTNIIFIS